MAQSTQTNKITTANIKISKVAEAVQNVGDKLPQSKPENEKNKIPRISLMKIHPQLRKVVLNPLVITQNNPTLKSLHRKK